jgi:peptide-methionine (S)-S-oxide reductase
MHMLEIATLGGGCFWCLEAFYQRVQGIESVKSGYSGGHADNPTATLVYQGDTGHAEVVQLKFKPEQISYREILEIFFSMHNPTTLNRQGNDVGREYRSVIFYRSEAQKQTAHIVATDYAAKIWKNPIVTLVIPFKKFWSAGGYNQNFYNNNPSVGYCQIVIDPKIQKLRQKFASKLKPI